MICSPSFSCPKQQRRACGTLVVSMSNGVLSVSKVVRRVLEDAVYDLVLLNPLQDAMEGATTVNQPSVVLMTSQTKPTVDDGAFVYPSPAYCSTIRDDGLKVVGTIRDVGFELDAPC